MKLAALLLTFLQAKDSPVVLARLPFFLLEKIFWAKGNYLCRNSTIALLSCRVGIAHQHDRLTNQTLSPIDKSLSRNTIKRHDFFNHSGISRIKTALYIPSGKFEGIFTFNSF